MTPFAKYRAKRMLHTVGIAPRRLRPARRDLAATCRHLRARGFEPGTVIDVGVADGTFEIYTTFPRARYLLIEPMIEFKAALAHIARHYDARFLIAAADDRVGEVELHFSPDDLHGASVMTESATGDQNGQPRRRVPGIRLDEWAADESLPPPYLIKLDTQGSELRVLDGAGLMLERTEAIIVETSFFRFKAEAPLFHEVVAYMSERGFVAYDVFGGYLRPLDGALAQVDLTFVREDGMFRRSHAFAGGPPRAGARAIARLRRSLGV